MMIFVNHMLSLQQYNHDVLHTFLIILNPFAPHLSEELNELTYKKEYIPISEKDWPEFDESLIFSDSVTIAIQINGKTRGTIDIEIDAKEDSIFEMVMKEKTLNKYIVGKNVVKKITIPNRLMNILVS